MVPDRRRERPDYSNSLAVLSGKTNDTYVYTTFGNQISQLSWTDSYVAGSGVATTEYGWTVCVGYNCSAITHMIHILPNSSGA